MRLPIMTAVLTFLLAALPAAAQQHKTARQHEAAEPDAAFLRVPASENGQDRIHGIRARVRHRTVIVLPPGERILDFVAGDSEYWHLTGAATSRISSRSPRTPQPTSRSSASPAASTRSWSRSMARSRPTWSSGSSRTRRPAA